MHTTPTRKWWKLQGTIRYLLVMTRNLWIQWMKTFSAQYVNCLQRNRFKPVVVTDFAKNALKNIYRGTYCSKLLDFQIDFCCRVALILELLLHNLWWVSVQQHNASTISVSSSDYTDCNQFGRDFQHFCRLFNYKAAWLTWYILGKHSWLRQNKTATENFTSLWHWSESIIWLYLSGTNVTGSIVLVLLTERRCCTR